jgi:hypothetical protein
MEMARSLMLAFALTGVLSMANAISQDTVIETFMERQGINDPAFAKYANLMRASFKVRPVHLFHNHLPISISVLKTKKTMTRCCLHTVRIMH